MKMCLQQAGGADDLLGLVHAAHLHINQNFPPRSLRIRWKTVANPCAGEFAASLPAVSAVSGRYMWAQVSEKSPEMGNLLGNGKPEMAHGKPEMGDGKPEMGNLRWQP